MIYEKWLNIMAILLFVCIIVQVIGLFINNEMLYRLFQSLFVICLSLDIGAYLGYNILR